ncbi:helix-turn-helix domain-containing protein [Effusibacillus lacus]|uniref:Transcriptional regulator n=1 Tax=Effusibacillus lacus TaxID=1348429 RepID=A0A292YC06_9BACL|nr:helix-turn-helix transcriptional regulator [Effusibacillus lacus]TCS74498.1 DNA-binding XRE family transcriptional regulator [Effusibacillus lacus]GAX88632.1 transcriptional regulator [Effusibacillus lacus]
MGETLGKRLRAYRKLKNLTQQELADLLGISIAIVGGIERGTREPSKDVLLKISRILGVTESELRGDSI